MIDARSKSYELEAIVGTLALNTFSRTYLMIEGYLAKQIDTKGLLRRQKRHLRYYRIIFSSGKLCIKEDRADTQMRSFLLRDIIHVQSLFCESTEHH